MNTSNTTIRRYSLSSRAGIQLIVVVLLLCSIAVETPAVLAEAAVDSSNWEWRLSEWTMGTVFMRPSSSDPWGTVCSTGMKSPVTAAFICRKVGLVPPEGGSITALWDVVPGPSSSPRYLDEAWCPSGMTDLHNCSWGAGDPLVLGAGYRPSGCTHQEDLFITYCRLAGIPTTIQYQLEPLSGLGSTARTGTLQAKIAPGMPWGRVLMGGASGFPKGVPQMLCEAMYPDITTEQLYNRAALLPQSMCTESTTAAANTFTAFKWDYYELEDEVLGFSATYTEVPMCITCEATHEARLIHGGVVYRGNAQIKWEVPGVYTGAWSNVCKPASVTTQMLMAEIICDAQCSSGYCTGVVVSGTPYGTVTTTDTYATSVPSLQEAVNWPASQPRQLAKLGLVYPPMYKRLEGFVCGSIFPIMCGGISNPPAISRTLGGSREISKAVLAYSSMRLGNLPLVYVNPTFWEGMAVCNTLGYTGSTPKWTSTSDLLEKYTAALVCDNDLPSIDSETLSCKVEPRLSNPTTAASISCATKPVNSRYSNTESVGYENPDLYEFRLTQSTLGIDYVEGTAEIRGNSARAWQPFCVDYASTTTEREIAATIMCQTVHTGSVYGELTTITYVPPTPIGPGETALSAVGMGICKTSASSKITGKDTVVTNKICPLERKGMLCWSRFSVRCYDSFQYRFLEAAPDGKSGILQAKLGDNWRAVRLGSIKAAELICAEMSLPSDYAFYDFFSTTNVAAGDYYIYFEDCPATAQLSSDCPHLPFGSVTGVGYVKLYCQQPIHPPTGFEFQLTGGATNNGNLEMRLTSEMPWSHVCAESLTLRSDAAKLACLSLFGSRVTQVRTLLTTALVNTNQIRNLYCDDYSNISSCRAGYVLESLPAPICTTFSAACVLMGTWNVRLVGGTAASNGKVQVQDDDDIGANWLTVCNDNFRVDRRLWSAVCTHVGHPHPRPTYRLDSTISTSGDIAGVGMYGHNRCANALSAGGFANIALQCFTKFEINCKHEEDSFLDCAPTLTTTATLTLGGGAAAITPTESQTSTPTPPQTYTLLGNTVTPSQTAASTLSLPKSKTLKVLRTSTSTMTRPMTTSDPITASTSHTNSASPPTATPSPPMTSTLAASGTHTIISSTTNSLSIGTMSATLSPHMTATVTPSDTYSIPPSKTNSLTINTMSTSTSKTASSTQSETAPDTDTATLTQPTTKSQSISTSDRTGSSTLSRTVVTTSDTASQYVTQTQSTSLSATKSDTTSTSDTETSSLSPSVTMTFTVSDDSTTTTTSTSLSATLSNSLTTSSTTTQTTTTTPSFNTPSESLTQTLSETASKETVSTSPSPTTTITETDEITTSSTIIVNCVNNTWPPVGNGCLLTKAGCTTSRRTIQFNDWFTGKEVLYEVPLLFPLGIRREALLHWNESIRVSRGGSHPPPSPSNSPHQEVVEPQFKIEVNGGELYSRLSPPFIISEVPDNTEASVRIRVYVDTHTRSRLLIRLGRQLGSSEPSSAATTQIGALLATHPWSGIFNCSVPSSIDRMSDSYQASEVEVIEEGGISVIMAGGTSSRETWQPPPAAILQQWGIYLPLGGDVLFDSPPPTLNEGTRKAAQATATVGAVASVVAGPIAADMQALAALGAIACAPGGGSAAGQNQDASEDSIQSLSPVALTPTCTGLMLGNVAFIGACILLQSIAVSGVFFFKRVIKHERRYPIISALGLLRMPSLLFTAMAALQMGFLVCGYNLLQQGSSSNGSSGDGDSVANQQKVGLGATGLIFAVLIPVIAALATATLVTRRRFNIQFQSFSLSAPSRGMDGATDAPKTVDDLLSNNDDEDGDNVEVLNLQEDDDLGNDEEMQPRQPQRRRSSNTNINHSSLSAMSRTSSSQKKRTSDPISSEKQPFNPSKLRYLAVALFLPSSSIDNEYHPLTNAFSTLVGRTRLKKSVWSSVPYLTPLAMLPAVLSPVHLCEVMMWIAAALHILLGLVHLVFRPQAILFANITSGVAIVLNGMLVGCSAVLAGSPTESGPRSAIATLSLLQVILSVIRLLHVAVVSLAIPLLMALKMLARPVRVEPSISSSSSPPPITSSTMYNHNTDSDNEGDMDVEMMEPDGELNTSIVLDLGTESKTTITNKETHKYKLHHKHRRRSSASASVESTAQGKVDGSSAEVQPMWVVQPTFAPQWPPASWATDEEEHNDIGLGGDLLGALLDATAAIGPQATTSAPVHPPNRNIPRHQHHPPLPHHHHPSSREHSSLSPTPNASFVASSISIENQEEDELLEIEEDDDDVDDLDLMNTDTANRIKILRDPSKNPMAMMHSTAMSINGLKSRGRAQTLIKSSRRQPHDDDAAQARRRGKSVASIQFALYPFTTSKEDNENSTDGSDPISTTTPDDEDIESTLAPKQSNNNEINNEDI